MKNKGVLVLCTVIITGFLLCTFAITMCAFWDTKTISKKENRRLAENPEFTISRWFNGKYSLELSSFLNDHICGRNEILDMASDYQGLLKQTQSMEIRGNNSDNGDANISDTLILDDRILMLNISNSEYNEKFVKNANKIYKSLPKGIEKYLVLSPSRVEFEEKQFKKYSYDQKKSISYIYQKISNDVTKIDTYTYVEAATKAYDLNKLYFRTDHHWTHLCSAYAANAILQTMGFSMKNPENYNMKSYGGFYGYMYAFNNMTDEDGYVPDNLDVYDIGMDVPEEVHTYDDNGNPVVLNEFVTDPSRAGYYTFVRGSYSHIIIDGKNEGGKNLLMINDSYANTLATWLTEDYDTIVMVDPRYYKGGKKEFDEMLKDYDIDQFMICLCDPSTQMAVAGELENFTK